MTKDSAAAQEPPFVPGPGQVDYTNIRYAPNVNVVVAREGKILLVKRSPGMRLYPDMWCTIDGFLDDDKSIEEKAAEELHAELGIPAGEILEFIRGQALVHESEEYNKTWLTVPLLTRVKATNFTLDWEASEAKWFSLQEIRHLDLVPGCLGAIGQFFPEIL